jgi:hypothetical protein
MVAESPTHSFIFCGSIFPALPVPITQAKNQYPGPLHHPEDCVSVAHHGAEERRVSLVMFMRHCCTCRAKEFPSLANSYSTYVAAFPGSLEELWEINGEKTQRRQHRDLMRFETSLSGNPG